MTQAATPCEAELFHARLASIGEAPPYVYRNALIAARAVGKSLQPNEALLRRLPADHLELILFEDKSALIVFESERLFENCHVVEIGVDRMFGTALEQAQVSDSATNMMWVLACHMTIFDILKAAGKEEEAAKLGMEILESTTHMLEVIKEVREERKGLDTSGE